MNRIYELIITAILIVWVISVLGVHFISYHKGIGAGKKQGRDVVLAQIYQTWKENKVVKIGNMVGVPRYSPEKNQGTP